MQNDRSYRDLTKASCEAQLWYSSVSTFNKGTKECFVSDQLSTSYARIRPRWKADISKGTYATNKVAPVLFALL